MYYVTTKDFKTFSDTKLYYDPGFSVIDCVIVKKAKKDYVLVLKRQHQTDAKHRSGFRKIAIRTFRKKIKTLDRIFIRRTNGCKSREKLVVYYDNYGSKNYKALSTKDFVKFEDVSSKIKLPEGHKHGTITTITAEVLKGLIEKK